MLISSFLGPTWKEWNIGYTKDTQWTLLEIAGQKLLLTFYTLGNNNSL